MSCSQCGRQIPDGSLSCPYCGKIFATQRARPDSVAMPAAVNAKPASMRQTLTDQSSSLDKAVRLRRLQRWFFYALNTAVFLGALFYIVKISNDNANLIVNLQTSGVKLQAAQKQATDFQTSLDMSKQQLSNANASAEELRATLTKTNDSLQKAMTENQKLTADMSLKSEEATKTSAEAVVATAVAKNIILLTGVKLSATDLNKIPLGEINGLVGVDTDKDGLPDDAEPAFNSDPLKFDTDNDGYSDLVELNKNFNPSGKGALPADSGFAAKYKGRFILQASGQNYFAWYVNADGKRFYLGSTLDSFGAMRNSEYWKK